MVKWGFGFPLLALAAASSEPPRTSKLRLLGIFSAPRSLAIFLFVQITSIVTAAAIVVAHKSSESLPLLTLLLY